jgi:two-component system, oxyanion-binding sensor
VAVARALVPRGLIEKGLPLGAIAERVYRPDLYAAALAPAGAPVPETDRKREGERAADWTLPASPAPIPMGPDLLCDGAVFDPASAI